jgi:uncharacterized DUF497 family protein
LAKRVQAIGYQIRPAKHGFEIEGVSDTILKRFSKRAQQRDEVVREREQELGRKLSNDEIAHVVHQSRAKKIKGISTAEVRERQLAQLQPDELQMLRQVSASAQPKPTTPDTDCESKVLAHALAHVFERKSVVPEHELLAVALSHRQGEVDLPRLKQTLGQSPQLIQTERGLSSRAILEIELSLIQTVNEGRDAVAPVHPTYQPARWLSEDQQRAIFHVLRTGDRITGIRGLAGTGKTTALRELANACQEARIETLFCAPTAAATDVLCKEGFNARTLQSLLQSKPQLSKGQLVVLD